MGKRQLDGRTFLQLAWAMFKTGVIGFGGGPSVIPLIRFEAVTRYRWVTDDEFGDMFALANALPGPIATKMAAYLGYRQMKIPGAVAAVLAHIMPSALLMIALLSASRVLSGTAVLQGIAAVGPVIAVMLGMMAYEFAERAVKGLGLMTGLALFAASFALLELIGLHPAIVIAVGLGYGAVHFRAVEWMKSRRTRKKKEKKMG